MKILAYSLLCHTISCFFLSSTNKIIDYLFDVWWWIRLLTMFCTDFMICCRQEKKSWYPVLFIVGNSRALTAQSEVQADFCGCRKLCLSLNKSCKFGSSLHCHVSANFSSSVCIGFCKFFMKWKGKVINVKLSSYQVSLDPEKYGMKFLFSLFMSSKFEFESLTLNFFTIQIRLWIWILKAIELLTLNFFIFLLLIFLNGGQRNEMTTY